MPEHVVEREVEVVGDGVELWLVRGEEVSQREGGFWLCDPS